MNYLEKQTLLSSAIKAIDYIHEIENRSVAPTEEALTKLAAFEEELPRVGKDTMQTIDFLNQFGSPATMASNGNRYYGFVIGGRTPLHLLPTGSPVHGTKMRDLISLVR